MEKKIIPAENGETLQVNKSKVSRFDVYLGITENYLIFSQCNINKWLYEWSHQSSGLGDPGEAAAEEISDCIPLENIGTCFSLKDIQSCAIEKGRMGAVNCTITMKNGSFLKLRLPKIDWLPHQAKNREEILARLSGIHSQGDGITYK